MLVAIVVLVATWFLVSLFGYVVHRSLHQSWSGTAYKRHMTHHQQCYPSTDYQSIEYRDPGKDSTVLTFAIASIPMLAIPFILHFLGIVGWVLTTTMVIEMLLFGLANDRVHDWFHLTEHPANRFKVFRRWNALHFQHHIEMDTNFGIFSFGWDKVFGSYKRAGSLPTDYQSRFEEDK
jgi:sterol desaturase/sphingolipid hydroxylase (fatty acid hydroxylase superfamily)